MTQKPTHTIPEIFANATQAIILRHPIEKNVERIIMDYGLTISALREAVELLKQLVNSDMNTQALLLTTFKIRWGVE